MLLVLPSQTLFKLTPRQAAKKGLSFTLTSMSPDLITVSGDVTTLPQHPNNDQVDTQRMYLKTLHLHLISRNFP